MATSNELTRLLSRYRYYIRNDFFLFFLNFFVFYAVSKGGRIISQLQTTTGTRVKLSQKNEFFPGTHDRVALVQGEQPTMVSEAVSQMLRRLTEVRCCKG